jgi:outer membrane protein assembly factor BamD (BamD/ComL family)
MKVPSKSTIILGFVLPIFMQACGPSLEDQKAEITKLEVELDKDSGIMPDSVNSALAVGKYLDFVNAHPEDTMSPVYLFKGARYSAQTGNMHVAMQMLDRLLKEYPKHTDAPQALFLKGFLAETQMGDFKSAEKYYKQFLAKYPKHPMAKDATFSLKSLGKSPNQIMKEFSASDSIKAK